jgi:hypothetical protein
MGQRLGENICGVVLRAYTHERGGTVFNQIPNVVELDSDVFYVRMPYMIFCQPSSGIVVA